MYIRLANLFPFLCGAVLRLREVSNDEGRLLWSWANDPEVRALSFSSDPITWQQHAQWFEEKINDPNCIIYLAVNSSNEPIGQVRYQLNGKEAIISISIDQKFRGKGYGALLICLSYRKLFNASNIDTIHAYVKQNNEASTRVFSKAGFKNNGIAMIRGCKAIHFILRKDDVLP